MAGSVIRGVLVILACIPPTVCGAQETRGEGGLYPTIEPFDTGHLQVSDIHSLWYAQFGNREGKPVFVLHGGPGVGCYPRLAQYFDPGRFRIVLHDQRGAGRSLPPGELRDNTTQHLVGDIERLRKHLGIEEKFVVFGGSWGATLAVAYAETHPRRIAGMVIRGFHSGERDGISNGFAGKHMRHFFPDAIARLEAELPFGLEDFEPEPLLEFFKSGTDEAVRSVGRAWIRLAVKAGSLHAPDEKVEHGWGDYDPRPGALIDCHYASNGFFLKDGRLLRDASKLEDIPMTIINGRYDMICPPAMAFKLHKALPKSKLVIVEEAGHSEGETGITKALLRAVAEFE